MNPLPLALLLLAPAQDATSVPPFRYVYGTAHHVLPGTHTDESGYFSLCEGPNGKVYVGTAAYGHNAYLVEFDPKTQKQRIVLDVNKTCGLKTTGPTYAAQAKIHTRNHVGPSGTITVGSKQGYRRPDDRDKADYPGGYLMTYDPRSDKSVCLGMPLKGEGVNDVTADEKAGLVYVVTCEEHHWVLYDARTKQFREPDPNLRLTPYAQTLIDSRGRGVVLTRDFKLARFDPATGKLSVAELAGKVGTATDTLGPACWALTADAKSAYLVRMSSPTLYRLDLAADGPAVPVADLGPLLKGKGFDSRGSLIVGHDAQVYALYRVDNDTTFGTGFLHHLVSYDPAARKARDHGVLAVRNPDYFDFGPGKEGKPKPWTNGFHRLPDKTLTPLYHHMALTQAKDGTLYATVLAPFTLLQIGPKDYR